jgi:hypothetical protein
MLRKEKERIGMVVIELGRIRFRCWQARGQGHVATTQVAVASIYDTGALSENIKIKLWLLFRRDLIRGRIR